MSAGTRISPRSCATTPTRRNSNRLALTRAALAPFRVDRALIPVAAAMLDVGVYRALQRVGMDAGQAATTIAELIEARLNQPR